jgi:hypothetical protein
MRDQINVLVKQMLTQDSWKLDDFCTLLATYNPEIGDKKYFLNILLTNLKNKIPEDKLNSALSIKATALLKWTLKHNYGISTTILRKYELDIKKK